jgi:hypothetical protein
MLVGVAHSIAVFFNKMGRFVANFLDEPFKLVDLVDFLAHYPAHQGFLLLDDFILLLYLSIHFIILLLQEDNFFFLTFITFYQYLYRSFTLFDCLDVPLALMAEIILHCCHRLV